MFDLEPNNIVKSKIVLLQYIHKHIKAWPKARHVADGILKYILLQFLLQYNTGDPINNKTTLRQVMAWYRMCWWLR